MNRKSKYSFIIDDIQTSVANDSNDHPSWSIYETGDHKMLDLQLLNGERQQFNYGYFITAWTETETDAKVIKLFFTTHMVTIKGYCLDEIFDNLLTHTVTSIRANDIRYADSADDDAPFVTNIEIKWKGNQESSEEE